ncbi:MAG TPA: ABC transporter ATP-binding protein [Thermoanaerobaculia bacterium]|nr:ABC transporter ATP-binding protein [Thermoanaerobaculia bacterium]
MGVEIEARGLVRTFRDGERRIEVLRGVDLAVGQGEMAAVVGPSGSGKSTLLHLLGALDRPNEGEVVIGGQKLGELDPSALAAFRNQNLGFVFQFHELLDDFTAIENVMLPGRIAGKSPLEVWERAGALLEEVGLAERVDHFPSELSGGERQRVALCRALALEPPVLLADEPTGNLDPKSGEQVFELLLDLQRRHRMTTVLVTHNPEIARRCGRILLLESGLVKPLES